jgi:transcriptional regulator with XRE-family HTH domain
MPPDHPDLRAALLRAARGYSGIPQPTLAEGLGVHTSTLSRYERGEKIISGEMLTRAGELCGIPEWFMEYGFEVPVAIDTPNLNEKVEALERQMATVLEILTLRSVGPDSPIERREDREDPEASGDQDQPS